MKKSEVLRELELEELIGTPFEDIIKFRDIKKGDSKFFSVEESIPTFYLLEGSIQFVIYRPEGGEFYIDLSPGDLSGINTNLSSILEHKFQRSFEGELVAKTDSLVAELPLEKLLSLDIENKEKLLTKILKLSVREGLERSRYLFFKSIYSDEEFLIKALENNKLLNLTTKEISELLNINLRTLQRLLKNLVTKEIIEKNKKSFRLIDQDKLEDYKSKFEK